MRVGQVIYMGLAHRGYATSFNQQSGIELEQHIQLPVNLAKMKDF